MNVLIHEGHAAHNTPSKRAFRTAVERAKLKEVPRERTDDLNDHLRDSAPAAAFSAVRRRLVTTAGPALASAFVAGLLTIACLEGETRRGHAPARRVLWLVYAPLLVPQIAFFYGFRSSWSNWVLMAAVSP